MRTAAVPVGAGTAPGQPAGTPAVQGDDARVNAHTIEKRLADIRREEQARASVRAPRTAAVPAAGPAASRRRPVGAGTAPGQLARTPAVQGSAHG